MAAASTHLGRGLPSPITALPNPANACNMNSFRPASKASSLFRRASSLVRRLTNDRSYFGQEKTEATETRTLPALFPYVKNATIYSRDTMLAFASLVLALLFQSTTQAAPNVTLWDSGAAFSTQVTIEDRTAWKPVPTDLLTLESDPPKARSDPGYYGREYSFKGDAVVETPNMLAVFWSAKGRVVFYSKPSAVAGDEPAGTNALNKLLELVLARKKDSVSGFNPAEIVRNGDDEVALEVSLKGAADSSAVLDFGKTEIVAVNPSPAMKGVRMLAPFDYTVVPGFIGDDLIFSLETQSSGDSLCLPADTLLLGLLRGEGSELVMTWPKGKQQVRFGLVDEPAEGGRIESIEFENDGQSLYLAPLVAPGIWHKQVLSPSYLEKDVAIDWKRPFPAKWKTQLYEETLKTTFAFRESKGDIWRGVPGSYNYPVWFEADRAFYHLSKKVPPKGESLIYFLEGQGTPSSVDTPADILKETLGRPMADSILDVAGRRLRTHHRRGGEGVHRACTCGCTEAIQAIFETGDEVARKEEIKGDLEDMVYFVHHHVDRINEYRRFADELTQFLQGNKASSPELGAYLDSLVEIAGQIPQEYKVQQQNMKSFAYADDLVRRTQLLTENKGTNNLPAYMDLLKEWRAMGGAQDYVLAQCHTITRRLAQQAGYGCVNLPKAVALAQEVRVRARQCLRNPDGYEIWADY